MDLENAKENIQPLASGRNIQQLATAITADSQLDVQEELLKTRQEYELAVQQYVGDDPLGPWYEYVQWVEQSYPKSGKESALDELLLNCLVKFEADERYKQDHRMIKLYIKYIDSQPNPTEHYQTLYEMGIGTMVADLYIAWAYYYDLCDDFSKANGIFRKGLDARAQPIDQLEQAHTNFGFSMSQRMLNKECETYRKEFRSTMEERRFALTSLRAHKHNKHVGSIRTGHAIKSYQPGKINTTVAVSGGSGSSSAASLINNKKSNSGNVRVCVYNEEQSDLIDKSSKQMPPPPPPPQSSSSSAASSSVVQIIMDSSKGQENLREPGPWSKANQPLNQSVFSVSSTGSRERFPSNSIEPQRNDQTKMSFSILEDMDQTLQPIPLNNNNYLKGIQLPERFYRKNEPQKPFEVPSCGEENAPPPRAVPSYDKILLFPKPDKSFSIEELAAYKWFHKKGIRNSFCEEYDKVWKNEFNVGIRMPPFFCSKSSTPADETPWTAARFIDDQPTKNSKFNFDINKIYPPDDETVEYSFEELLTQKWLKGELRSQMLQSQEDELDETVCINRRQSINKCIVRKSICPGGRKSIMPAMDETRKSIWDYSKIKSFIPSSAVEPKKVTIDEEEELPPVNQTTSSGLNIFRKTTTIETKTTTTSISMNSVKKNDLAETKLKIFSSNSKTQEKIINETVKTSSTELSTTVTTNKNHQPTCPPSSIVNTAVVQPIEQGAIPKAKGILRKSINPTMKRKINPNESEIPKKEICFASTTADIEMSSPSKKDLDKITKPFQFPVYIDNDDNFGTDEINTQFISPKSTSPTNDKIFKTPKIPNINKTSPLNPDGDFNSEKYYADDTCSTVQFFNFIKSTGISTPNTKNQRNSNEIYTDEVLNESFEPVQTEQQKPMVKTDPILTVPIIPQQESSTPSPPQPPPQQQQQQLIPRCLSTIMETTETNTLSSATTNTTKSSQFNSSPETEFEINTKSHFGNSNFDQPSRISSLLVFAAPPTTHSNLIGEPLINSTTTANIHKITPTPLQINNNDDKENIPLSASMFPISNDQTNATTLEENTENIFFTEFSSKPKILQPPAAAALAAPPSSPPVKLIYPSEIPSMASIQIYEDHTETIPLTNFIKSSQITVGDPQNPSSSVAQMKEIKNDIGNTSVGAIKSICQIPIYEDQTETIPLLSIRCSGKSEATTTTTSTVVQDIKNKTLSEPTITIPLMNFSHLNKTSNNSTSPPKISNKSLHIMSMMPDESEQSFNDPTLTIPSMILPNTKTNCQTEQQSETTTMSIENRNISINNDTIKVNRNSMFPKLVISNARTTMSAFTNDFQQQEQQNHEKQNQIEMSQQKLGDIDDYFNELFAKTPVQVAPVVNTDTLNQSKQIPSTIAINQPLSTQTFSKSSFISPGKSRIPIPKSTLNSSGKKGDLTPDDQSLLMPMIPNLNTTPKLTTTTTTTNTSFNINTETIPPSSPRSSNFDNNQPFTTPSKLGKINNPSLNLTGIPEQSFLCVKNEPIWTPSPMQYSSKQLKDISKISDSLQILEIHSSNNSDDEMMEKGENPKDNQPQQQQQQQDLEQSIYVPKMEVQLSSREYVKWNEVDVDDDEPTTTINNEYLLKPINLNETKQVINAHCVNESVNPFDTKIKDAFLEQCELLDYIQNLPNCCLVNIVKPLRPHVLLEINDQEFNVDALLGKGAYGHIFKAKCTRTGDLYALKQERPANLWEYYICLEIESRIDVPNILPAFMCVEYALIGNNASILCSRFSQYGNLIEVCNKVNTKTQQNVPEKIVMLLTIQMLSIVDHLHACNIIHADIKPDNWLLVRKLSFEPNDIALQLIDFGESIDMNLYPAGQTFNYHIKTKNFTCTEMLNNRPWTFQTDLYCLAGTIYTILMGRYMEVDRKLNGYEVRHGLPRYFQRNIWSQLFNTLINVKDCQNMPNLQSLRTMLLTEIANDIPKKNDQIVAFNKIIG